MIMEKIKRFVNFSTSEVFGINAFRVDEKSSAKPPARRRGPLDLFGE